MTNPALRRLLIAVLCLLAAPNIQAAEAPAATAEWRIETRQHTNDVPTSQLDLVINGWQVVPVESAEILGDYRVIARQDFARLKIPAKALCACQSHVVNSGVYYYVVAAGNDGMALYRQLEDDKGLTGFKKIRTVKLAVR